jgi:hypothetical protein
MRNTLGQLVKLGYIELEDHIYNYIQKCSLLSNFPRFSFIFIILYSL